MFNKILITGGAGFICSALIRSLIKNQIEVINIDKLTYAGHLSNLHSISHSLFYHFYRGDITDDALIYHVLEKHQPAETYVDSSIEASHAFIQINIVGTYVLLEQALKYWKKNKLPSTFRFHHVSIDEVFGVLDSQGIFNEQSPYQPNSPYSASKTSSDFLVRAWGKTHGLPCVISNCSNSYFTYQSPGKLIPHMIIRAIKGMSLPLYDDCEQICDWLYVDDHVQALWQVFKYGRQNETYLIGGNQEKTNLDVVQTICHIVDELRPLKTGSYLKQLTHVQDRLGHDQRYTIDASKLRKEFDWQPLESFELGIQKKNFLVS